MSEASDHDQRFKALIREFFADFLTLFFADWAARFDLSAIEWLDKELLPDPPEGARHLLDLVARLRVTQSAGHADPDPATWLALVHIEVEAPQKTTLLKPRLPGYYLHLRDHYGLPVLPVVVYLKVGLNGIGVDTVTEQFWELETLKFSYLYVGLPALDAEAYVHGDNWLGVALAALMRLPPDRVAELGAEALRRISEAPLGDQKRFLLAECVQAYLPLDAQQQAVYQRIMEGERYSGVQAMNRTVRDEGIEEGLERGRRLALLGAVERLLARKFRDLPPDLPDRIRRLSDDQLDQLIIDAAFATSLAELGL
jgi:hypothetical protein